MKITSWRRDARVTLSRELSCACCYCQEGIKWFRCLQTHGGWPDHPSVDNQKGTSNFSKEYLLACTGLRCAFSAHLPAVGGWTAERHPAANPRWRRPRQDRSSGPTETSTVFTTREHDAGRRWPGSQVFAMSSTTPRQPPSRQARQTTTLQIYTPQRSEQVAQCHLQLCGLRHGAQVRRIASEQRGQSNHRLLFVIENIHLKPHSLAHCAQVHRQVRRVGHQAAVGAEQRAAEVQPLLDVDADAGALRGKGKGSRR